MLRGIHATKTKNIFSSVWKRKTEEDNSGYGVFVSLENLIAIGKKATGLLLSPRGNIMSSSAGLFRSTFKGRGMEFDEVRKYQIGDDIRHIHWRVTARTGEPHTKLFHEEKERPVHILLDSRINMKFGTKTAFKSVVAARIASILAWAAKENGDRVGGIVLSPSKEIEMPPQRNRRRLLRLLHTICEATNEMATKNESEHSTEEPSLADAINKLRHVSRTGGLSFIISDFHDIDDESLNRIGSMSLHSDVAFIKVNDPLEKKSPPPNLYRISNGNEFSFMDTNSKKWRKEFENEFKEKHQTLKTFCNKRKILFVEIDTNDDIVAKLKSSFNGGKKHGRK
jgi:uncharacterized protein (DUF58 family)